MRGKRSLRFPIFSILLFFSTFSYAQLWSGIIDPSRAVDWSSAGIPGGIPSRTTQCGSTIAAYTGTSATIQNAIAACPAGQYVSLGAGTFQLSNGISFGGHNNVTLRGQGANSTFLVFTGAGAGYYGAVVSMESTQLNENDSEGNVCDWTAGYTQGGTSTTITLANCGTTTPARGSLSNLHVGGILILDQVDETADTGTIWNCATMNVCGNTTQGGSSRQDGPTVNGTAIRSQEQGVIVQAISGNQVTISPGLYMPNWRNGQKPQAWFVNSSQEAVGMGLENLSIDTTNAGSNESVMIANCDQCYVNGVRSVYANRSHVRMLYATRFTVQNGYFYENISHASVSYGAEIMGGWNGLIQNNIFQQDTDSEPSCSGACEGNVIAYNFDVNNVWTQSSGWMQAGFYHHAAGDAFNLWEGNIGPGFNSDQVHGTHHFETLFRNYLIGNNQSTCNGVSCSQQTIPVHLYGGSRYFNVIGNVLGQAGYHTNYTCLGSAAPAPDPTNGDVSIYALGASGNECKQYSLLSSYCQNPSCSTHNDADPQVAAYLMRWGNYDTVNNAVRFVSSEVPSGLPQYPNPVPGSQALPPSFYLTSMPSFFITPQGTLTYPPVGPDVTGGNIPGLGGHANMIPAWNCYTNVMGGPADGSGSVLSFKADQCYGAADPPPPPNNLAATVH